MADEAETGEKVREFPGLVTNANPHRIPVGATVEQTNCSSPRAGELDVRTGLREVTFDN